VANGPVEVTYTIGYRNDRAMDFPTHVNVTLMAMPSGIVLAQDSNSLTDLNISAGQATTRTLSFDTAFGNPANGDNLAIVITAAGASRSQAALDDFFLTFDRPSTTPSDTTANPSTIALTTTMAMVTTAEDVATTTAALPTTAMPATTTQETPFTTEERPGLTLSIGNPSFEDNFINWCS
jgi:hypothetical protein